MRLQKLKEAYEQEAVIVRHRLTENSRIKADLVDLGDDARRIPVGFLARPFAILSAPAPAVLVIVVLR